MTPTDAHEQQGMGSAERATAVPRAERPYREDTASPSSEVNDQAARSVMHPESYDPEWRYYHGAWGG
jgi:hypothetical protein